MRLTLKDHRDAMVAMLANGNCPTSAARLAHAMHDVLSYLQNEPEAPVSHSERRAEATTPGLNDKLLALDLEAHRKPQTTESLNAELKVRSNTIKQLKKGNRILLQENAELTRQLQESLDREQAMQEYYGVVYVPDNAQLTPEQIETIRQASPASSLPDANFTNELFSSGSNWKGLVGGVMRGVMRDVVQSGVRKEDTELQDDGWVVNKGNRAVSGATKVEVRFVNGTKAEGPAADFGWSIGEHGLNIIAYRVVTP